jgi:hypothetical protein
LDEGEKQMRHGSAQREGVRSRFSRTAAGVAAGLLLLGGQAQANPLDSATLEFFLATLPPATFVGNGSSAGTAANVLSATLASGSAFSGMTTPSFPNPATVTNVIITIGPNGPGSFTGYAPQRVRGSMAVGGTAKIKGLGVTLLAVPLALGVVQTNVIGTSPGIVITAFNGSWTAGTAAVTGVTGIPVTLSYSFHTGASTLSNMITTTGTVTMMGRNALKQTLSGTGVGGTLTLVTPTKVLTNIMASPIVPTFARLTLNFVPEPSQLLMLGTGSAILLLMGVRRRR